MRKFITTITIENDTAKTYILQNLDSKKKHIEIVLSSEYFESGCQKNRPVESRARKES